MNKLLSIALALSVSSATLLASSVALAEYPEKPVTFVVPFPPGDLEDILTRMIADQFQKDNGVAAAVVNKPGGTGAIAIGAVPFVLLGGAIHAFILTRKKKTEWTPKIP